MKECYLVIIKETNFKDDFVTNHVIYENFSSAIDDTKGVYIKEGKKMLYQKIDWREKKATFIAEGITIDIMPVTYYL